jgi:uncharacterized protein (DUF433 family)
MHARVQSHPKILLGKPVVTGTRITVESILRKLAGGMSVAEIVEDHPNLTPEGVYAAAEYAADHGF